MHSTFIKPNFYNKSNFFHSDEIENEQMEKALKKKGIGFGVSRDASKLQEYLGGDIQTININKQTN